jgi:hypothetical protein
VRRRERWGRAMRTRCGMWDVPTCLWASSQNKRAGGRRERYLCEQPGRTGKLACLGLEWFPRGGGGRVVVVRVVPVLYLAEPVCSPVRLPGYHSTGSQRCPCTHTHCLPPASTSTSHCIHSRPPHHHSCLLRAALQPAPRPPSALPCAGCASVLVLCAVPPVLLIRQTRPDYGRSKRRTRVQCPKTPPPAPPSLVSARSLIQNTPNYQRSRRCMRIP